MKTRSRYVRDTEFLTALREHGPQTIRQLAERFALSVPTVGDRMSALVASGAVSRRIKSGRQNTYDVAENVPRDERWRRAVERLRAAIANARRDGDDASLMVLYNSLTVEHFSDMLDYIDHLSHQ